MIDHQNNFTQRTASAKKPRPLSVAEAFLLSFLFLFFFSPSLSHAQSGQYSGGAVALGMRSTMNYFTQNGTLGYGAGGQWKLGMSKKVNTEWFLDYIHTADRDHAAYRHDYHIGWSVQFALAKDGFGGSGITPYVLGGQCFDLSRVGLLNDESPLKFSAAAQAGVGGSIFLTPGFETTLQLQYMTHITGDLHVEENEYGVAVLETHKGPSLAGHALLTLSLNYYLIDLKK